MKTLFHPLAIVGVLCASVALAAPARAGLEFEKTAAEVHAMANDERVTATFPFTNTGDAAVTIRKVQSSCGCLSAKADKATIAPGESGTVTAVFDLGRFTGEQEKVLAVLTDEDGPGNYRLKVKVVIPEVFVVTPDLLEWEVGGEAAAKSFRITVPHTDPIHIVTIAPSRKGFAFELIEHKPGREYEIKLTPPSTDKPMLGVLRITTDCAIAKHRRQLAFFSISRPRADAAPAAKEPAGKSAESP